MTTHAQAMAEALVSEAFCSPFEPWPEELKARFRSSAERGRERLQTVADLSLSPAEIQPLPVVALPPPETPQAAPDDPDA